MPKIPITEFDIVYISYDEPNAEENYADLLDKCPWAKRSHGVWGSDAAHKAAAALSETERFIGIDADNIVDPDFFSIEIDTDKITESDVISWAGRNEVNGLVYGNGGIKSWPIKVVEQMRTHEAAAEDDSRSQVDFCWDIRYIQMNNIYSQVMNNASPYQAFRAGFREGVKMSLIDGAPVSRQQLKHIHRENYNRLLIWCTVGADVLNGLWAIYGARLGCHMVNVSRETWEWTNVRDFDWITQFWNDNINDRFEGGDDICAKTGYRWNRQLLLSEIKRLGTELRREIDLEIADLDKVGSRFFKATYVNPSRLGPMVREDQVEQYIGEPTALEG
jgi:hypothetical protein